MFSARPLSRLFRGALAAACLAALGPSAAVAADCYAVGQQVAAENGGTLARVSAREQGGRTVCVIVVLVPGRDGERPRREQFVVPAD